MTPPLLRAPPPAAMPAWGHFTHTAMEGSFSDRDLIGHSSILPGAHCFRVKSIGPSWLGSPLVCPSHTHTHSHTVDQPVNSPPLFTSWPLAVFRLSQAPWNPISMPFADLLLMLPFSETSFQSLCMTVASASDVFFCQARCPSRRASVLPVQLQSRDKRHSVVPLREVREVCVFLQVTLCCRL